MLSLPDLCLLARHGHGMAERRPHDSGNDRDARTAEVCCDELFFSPSSCLPSCSSPTPSSPSSPSVSLSLSPSPTSARSPLYLSLIAEVESALIADNKREVQQHSTAFAVTTQRREEEEEQGMKAAFSAEPRDEVKQESGSASSSGDESWLQYEMDDDGCLTDDLEQPQQLQRDAQEASAGLCLSRLHCDDDEDDDVCCDGDLSGSGGLSDLFSRPSSDLADEGVDASASASHPLALSTSLPFSAAATRAASRFTFTFSLPNAPVRGLSGPSVRSPEVVRRWLSFHCFDPSVASRLRGYTCSDLLLLTKGDAVQLIGAREGIRLFYRLHECKQRRSFITRQQEEEAEEQLEPAAAAAAAAAAEAAAAAAVCFSSSSSSSSACSSFSLFSPLASALSPAHPAHSSAFQFRVPSRPVPVPRARSPLFSPSYRLPSHVAAQLPSSRRRRECSANQCSALALHSCGSQDCQHTVCSQHAFKSLVTSSVRCIECAKSDSRMNFCVIA